MWAVHTLSLHLTFRRWSVSLRSATARAHTRARCYTPAEGTSEAQAATLYPGRTCAHTVPRHVLLKTLSEIAALSYVNIGVNAVLTIVVIASALNNPPDTPPSTTLAVRPTARPPP